MKRYLIAIPVGVYTFIAFNKLVLAGGAWLVVAITVGTVVAMAWLKHTPDSAAMAEDVRGALGDIGWSDKMAALTCDVGISHWSMQMAGTEMLSAWKLASLPPEFHIAFARRRLARFGEFMVLESGPLTALVERVDALVGLKSMAKMALGDERKQGAA
jgi:hypothetical protein